MRKASLAQDQPPIGSVGGKAARRQRTVIMAHQRSSYMTLHRICVMAAFFALASTSAAAQPAAATLISPSADVNSTTIAFTWQSAPTATWYHFWLGKADTTLVMEQWYTAAHAGCETGGTCTITVTPPVTAGAFIWYVRTWSSAGYGPWSAPHMFTVRDVMQAWSGTLPASRRFTIVLNGQAVLDNETGLVWERTPGLTQHEWSSARFVCALSSTGSRRGWRVPTVSEILSLVDTSTSNPSLPAGHPFVMGPSIIFWTATPSTQTADYYFVMQMVSGAISQVPGSNFFRLWCVRGGVMQ
jgi:hypothetical protein